MPDNIFYPAPVLIQLVEKLKNYCSNEKQGHYLKERRFKMLTKEKPQTDIKQKINSFGPWIKWLIKREVEEYKATSAYIEMLCPHPKVRNIEDSSIRKLEKLVRATIISEFGARIEHSASFNYLVSSVMYKLLRQSMD